MYNTIANPKAQKPLSFQDVVEDFFKLAHTVEKTAKTKLFDSHIKANISEHDNSYTITIAMPGVAKSDLNIEVDNQTLNISVKQVSDDAEKTDTVTKEFVWKEFDYTKASRSFRLSKVIDLESIKAEMTDGILSITLSKKPAFVPKTINVQ